ncbi:MAG: hypothetical protein A3G24_10055 [Betaproteobacteria bacterium RIFCSPLOWO2_12_FULL_62_13]|nr:MAG: hypothetical protein A3G24_10055 [Betaproteobacteria bacterium RIFCSPLOWO2_12_FULL_62_13]
MTSRSYTFFMLGLCTVTLLPVLALNLLLTYNNLRYDKNALAAEWQRQTRGVTYAPPISHNRPFKTLRLNDRIADINAVVFGSSTAMGIREDSFPPAIRAYNFAQSGNALLAVIGEAEYIIQHWSDRVRYLVIPLDWALGFVYEPGVPPPTELSVVSARAAAAALHNASLAPQLRDALALPRVKDLLSILKDVLASERKAAAFRQLFFEPTGEEYRCPDGALARDFDTIFRGQCVGFRFDGSATFADQKRVNPRESRALLASAAAAGSQYAAALRRRRGEPHAAILDRLASLARRFAASGGRTVFFLPPLMPELERALLGSAHSGAALARTKDALAAWAQRERLIVLDAGASERFGCTAAEFIDPHHALPECYRKIFSRFWLDYRGGVRPGLHRLE